tara:strand:- start:166 stop:435 length:270 start_codon:yes stop_codon:yes gene_type:complete
MALPLDVGKIDSHNAALDKVTKSQAVEFGKHNIQANCLCPGFVKTPLTETIWSDKTMQDWVESRLPAGRLATPKDVACDNWPLPGIATA